MIVLSVLLLTAAAAVGVMLVVSAASKAQNRTSVTRRPMDTPTPCGLGSWSFARPLRSGFPAAAPGDLCPQCGRKFLDDRDPVPLGAPALLWGADEARSTVRKWQPRGKASEPYPK